MDSSIKLPESIQKEIALYLSPEEKILDFIASASGPVGKLGELWMILTDGTVFFFTKEFGKDPVVALIARRDIRVIKYDHHSAGTNLTFVPTTHPRNSIKVPFPKAQRQQVNRFCEELAKTIPFELVNSLEKPSHDPPKDVKLTSAPSPSVPRPPSPGIAPPVPSPGHSDLVNSGVSVSAGPSSTPSSAPQGAEFEKLSTPEKMTRDEPAQILAPDPRFVVMVTIISVLVGFFWFHLFRSLFDEK